MNRNLTIRLLPLPLPPPSLLRTWEEMSLTLLARETRMLLAPASGNKSRAQSSTILQISYTSFTFFRPNLSPTLVFFRRLYINLAHIRWWRSNRELRWDQIIWIEDWDWVKLCCLSARFAKHTTRGWTHWAFGEMRMQLEYNCLREWTAGRPVGLLNGCKLETSTSSIRPTDRPASRNSLHVALNPRDL